MGPRSESDTISSAVAFDEASRLSCVAVWTGGYRVIERSLGRTLYVLLNGCRVVALGCELRVAGDPFRRRPSRDAGSPPTCHRCGPR